MSNEFDPQSQSFIDGMTDGYAGYTPAREGDENYDAGYAAGESQFAADQQVDDYFDYGYSYEDYDPSPYDGTYSEM